MLDYIIWNSYPFLEDHHFQAPDFWDFLIIFVFWMYFAQINLLQRARAAVYVNKHTTYNRFNSYTSYQINSSKVKGWMLS